MMVQNLMQTGLMFALFLLIPGMLKESDPPDWFKIVVLTFGFGGLVAFFVSAIWVIWAD
tara:strand:- start:32905 stop:33081 length:177 start_codon:yes stop_codon:yes gene_type:complete